VYADVMATWWQAILREQQATRFADLAGTRASVSVPVADRLINEIIAQRLSRQSPLVSVTVRSVAGNVVHIQATPRQPLVPRLRLELTVIRQPEWPLTPLVLRLRTEGMASSLAASTLRFLNVLPPGLRLEGDLLTVDLAALARQYGGDEVIRYLTRIELTTVDGAVVVAADFSIPPVQ
jgi:hypothetical protein